jgi:endoglucanase
MRFRRMRASAALASALVLGAGSVLPAQAAAPTAVDDPGGGPGISGSALFADPLSTTLAAAQGLQGQARSDAQLLASIPSATWLAGGTPQEARAKADRVVTAAAKSGTVPVLVAYNLPFRDCALYSAGGAADTKAYNAWIDGVAAGIGNRRAIVLIEPDGLGVIPFHTTLDGSLDSCRPEGADPERASDARFEQLNHAVDALSALPSVATYLDGTNAAWLNVGEISSRLVRAGVGRTTGFFLNVSNYLYTKNSNAYGTWVSSCIAYATQVAPGRFKDCGDQFWNGGPANDWQGVAMSQYGEWSAGAADPALDTAGVDSRYAAQLGGVKPTARFIVDTSRNGIGPWQYPVGVYPQHEDWCNPPGRGAGQRPTTSTGVDLADAYLWVKVPGESDGQCYRGTAGPLDPARGIQDPPAGQWFPEQARELVANAVPALAPLTCEVTVTSTGHGASFSQALRLRNLGTTAAAPWALSWTFGGDQKVKAVPGATFVQRGAEVSVSARGPATSLAPGAETSLVVRGVGAADAPWQFRLNGAVCATR